MFRIARILVMESGSFGALGGAAKDTYWLYSYLKKELRGAEIDVYGDLSGIGPNVKYGSKSELLAKPYDIILLNSIRDSLVVEQYIRKTGREPFTIYTDRAGVITHYYSSPLKRLVSYGARISVFSNPEPFEKFANSARSHKRAKGAKEVREFFSKSYELHMFKRMSRWLDCYVAISTTQMNDAERFFRGTGAKLTYIPRAPHPNFKPLNMHDRGSAAVYAGRLEETQKRLSFLLKGVARAAKRSGINSSAVLLKIAGEGPDAETYRSMASNLGISKNVEFLGFKADDDLVKLYNSSAFAVSTSEWESSGRSMLEAMACGIPVLLNDKINTVLGGSPIERLVRDGHNGLVYRHGDLEDFAEKFMKLHEDAELRIRMGAHALAFARKFDFTGVVAGYRRIIEEAHPEVR